MDSMYTLAGDMAELYGLLEDERSKDIFGRGFALTARHLWKTTPVYTVCWMRI